MIIISVYIFVLQQDLIKHKISLNINFEYYSPIISQLCADDTNDTSILSNLQKDVQATGLPLFTPIYLLIMFLKSMRLEFRINCIKLYKLTMTILEALPSSPSLSSFYHPTCTTFCSRTKEKETSLSLRACCHASPQE